MNNINDPQTKNEAFTSTDASTPTPDNCEINPDNLITETAENESYIIYIVAAFCIMIFLIMFKNAGSGVLKSLRSTFKNILNTASIDLIIVCLIIMLSVTYIIKGKIEGYYEGIYEYNTQNSSMETKPIKVIGQTENVPTPYGMPGNQVNLTEINTILHKITTLGYCTFVMLAIAIIFKHYPMSSSSGPVSKIKSVMAILAITFAILGFYVFANCFANLDQLNNIAQKTPKTQVEHCDKTYYLPTIKEHIYPPLRMIYNLWVVAIIMIVIATGAAFATLFVNISKKTHSMITIQSNLITELSQEGRLIAYELNDPLFKLIDNAIAKKVKQRQLKPEIIQTLRDDGTTVRKVRTPYPERAVIPRYSKDVPLKLFDFVKFKEFGEVRDKRGNLVAKHLGPNQDQLYLIAAANNWTIINRPDDTSGRVYYHVGYNADKRAESYKMPEDFGDERVLRDGVEQPKKRLDGKVIHIKPTNIFAYTQQELDAMPLERRNSLEPHLDSRLAKDAIFGNQDYMNTPDNIHQQEFDKSFDNENKGSLKEDAKLILIPINETVFNLTKKQQNDPEFESLLHFISLSLRTGETAPNPDADVRKIKGHSFKSLLDLIHNHLIDVFINKNTPRGQLNDFTPQDLSLVRRIKENINLIDLTALDLIHIRYSLLENIVYKHFADHKGIPEQEIHTLYKDRMKRFPPTENLIKEILPGLKEYVDPADRAEFDNFKNHDGQTTTEIAEFARRFNVMVGLEPKIHEPDKFMGITKKTYEPLYDRPTYVSR